MTTFTPALLTTTIHSINQSITLSPCPALFFFFFFFFFFYNSWTNHFSHCEHVPRWRNNSLRDWLWPWHPRPRPSLRIRAVCLHQAATLIPSSSSSFLPSKPLLPVFSLHPHLPSNEACVAQLSIEPSPPSAGCRTVLLLHLFDGLFTSTDLPQLWPSCPLRHPGPTFLIEPSVSSALVFAILNADRVALHLSSTRAVAMLMTPIMRCTTSASAVTIF
jgi:hypothetical protein